MNRRRILCFLFCFAIALAGQQVFAQFLAGGGVNTSDPSLPPLGYPYLAPTDVWAMYHGPGLAVVLSKVEYKPFALGSHQTAGPDEIENYSSTEKGQISVNGSANQLFSGSSFDMMLVHGKIGNTTGTFNTEMLQLALSGSSPFGPFMLRESPTLASLGETKITDIGGGLYHIDSFFDVFTELSVDGGSSWIPSDTSTHVDLVTPEPTTVTLLGLGLLGLVGLARRRR